MAVVFFSALTIVFEVVLPRTLPMAVCGLGSGPALATYAGLMIAASHDRWRALPIVGFVVIGLSHLAWSNWIAGVLPVRRVVGLDEFPELVLITGAVFAVCGGLVLRTVWFGGIAFAGTACATIGAQFLPRHGLLPEAFGMGVLHIGIALGLAWYVRSHTSRLHQPGRCPFCDYDCEGIASGVCPECGRSSTTPTQDLTP